MDPVCIEKGYANPNLEMAHPIWYAQSDYLLVQEVFATKKVH